MAQLTDREPARTIYHDWWTETRERVRRGRRKERALLEPLIESIEDGWRHVRLLELLYEEHEQRARGRDPLGRLLSYIDIDVVDVYRGFVYDLAKLVRCVEAGVTTECIDSVRLRPAHRPPPPGRRVRRAAGGPARARARRHGAAARVVRRLRAAHRGARLPHDGPAGASRVTAFSRTHGPCNGKRADGMG
jgi:hypothetical protein